MATKIEELQAKAEELSGMIESIGSEGLMDGDYARRLDRIVSAIRDMQRSIVLQLADMSLKYATDMASINESLDSLMRANAPSLNQ